jgi:hypothetical protein
MPDFIEEPGHQQAGPSFVPPMPTTVEPQPRELSLCSFTKVRKRPPTLPKEKPHPPPGHRNVAQGDLPGQPHASADPNQIPDMLHSRTPSLDTNPESPMYESPPVFGAQVLPAPQAAPQQAALERKTVVVQEESQAMLQEVLEIMREKPWEAKPKPQQAMGEVPCGDRRAQDGRGCPPRVAQAAQDSVDETEEAGCCDSACRYLSRCWWWPLLGFNESILPRIWGQVALTGIFSAVAVTQQLSFGELMAPVPASP